MKKLLFILLAPFLFAACSSGPESTARNFAEAIAKGDLDSAKKYATAQTGALLDMAKSMSKADDMPTYPDYKFEAVKDSVSGDKAWVTYKEPTGGEGVIELVKENGDWKVTVGK